jgi:Mg2+ and Co2+ transporter CorA
MKTERTKEALAEKLKHKHESQGEHIDVTTAVFKRHLEELRRQLKDARDAERTILADEERGTDLSKRLAQIEKELKSSEHALGQQRDVLREAQASLKERETGFPLGLQNPVALRKALRDAKAADEELKTALENAQKEERAAQKSCESTLSSCEAASARIKRAKAALAGC